MTWFLAVDNWSNSITSPVPGHACQPADACEPVGAESHAWVCYGLEVQITVHMCIPSIQFSRSVVSDSLWPHGLQLARPPCPSPTPGVYSDSYPLSQWCHPTISSFAISFSSHLQYFPASGSFQMRWPKYWSFSFNISPSNEHSELISFRMDWRIPWSFPNTGSYDARNASTLFTFTFVTDFFGLDLTVACMKWLN